MPDETGDEPDIGRPPAVEPASVRAALTRIVSSEAFRGAPQLVAFLTFVVEKALAGQAHAVKGYTIATEALGRDAGFDPQSDPIVRVEAGRLRRALDAYYAQASEETVTIAIPRGSYVPTFARRPASSRAPVVDPSPEQEPAAPAEPALPAEPSGPGPRLRRRGRILVPLGLLLALVAASFAWLSSSFQNPGPGRRAGMRTSAAPVERADGRAIVALQPVEAAGSQPKRFSGPVLRSMVLDGLARFDEIIAVDQDRPVDVEAPERYALNLRVTGLDGAVTVTARLTHQPSGNVIWSREFDPFKGVETGSPPEVDAARQIATSIGQPYGVLFADLRTRVSADSRIRCIIQAYDYWTSPSAEAHARVRDCLERIVASAGGPATAHANLAFFYLDEFRVGFNLRPDPVERALQAARKAVELAPESARAHQAMMAVLFFRGEANEALQHGRRALELNPYDTDVLADYGARLIQTGRYAEGEPLIRRAAAANPADPPWYHFFLFLAGYMQGDMRAAEAAVAHIGSGDYVLGLVARLIVAGQAGDGEAVRALIERLGRIQPEFTADPAAALGKRRFIPAVNERLLAGLAQAGLPGAGRP